jgi:hypothetical protein
MNPTAFASYSWDDDPHRMWVASLATRLRSDGVNVRLDQWNTAHGDQLPAFMEREIRDNAFVLIVCTPKYKLKSDTRQGGVGYEGDIMTGEVFNKQNHRKFIPILARGTWTTSAPSWLAGSYYVDLSSPEKFEVQYGDLLLTLLGRRAPAPPLGNVLSQKTGDLMLVAPSKPNAQSPVKILGVIVDEVTEPRMDGTPGSALYRVPFRLSRSPSAYWASAFLGSWDSPRQFTSMHRFGAAGVSGDSIILDGTTIEEVERYHRHTLLLCVEDANQREVENLKRLAEAQRVQESRRQQIRESAKNIKF